MKILFDHNIMAQQAFGGVSQYYLGMSACLPKAGVAYRMHAPLFINQHLRHVSDRHGQGIGLAATRVNRRLAMAVGQATMPLAVTRYRPDVIHQTLYDLSRTGLGRTPIVITIHDMIHELFPEQDPDGRWTARKRRAIHDADWIICDSRNTEIDLIRLYPAATGRTSVVHLAARGTGAPVEVDVPAPAGAPFLLYVGQRAGYKNFAGLLRAYAASPTLRREAELVCVGGGRFTPEEQTAIADAGIDDRVRHRNASDADLAALYRDAAMFVYPSLYEGFGIPPLEAMGVGCPVVAVRAGSVPEICGDAALYGEPEDDESLRDAIEQLWSSPSLRTEMIERGYKRAAEFSWVRCAAETAAVYRKVAG